MIENKIIDSTWSPGKRLVDESLMSQFHEYVAESYVKEIQRRMKLRINKFKWLYSTINKVTYKDYLKHVYEEYKVYDDERKLIRDLDVYTRRDKVTITYKSFIKDTSDKRIPTLQLAKTIEKGTLLLKPSKLFEDLWTEFRSSEDHLVVEFSRRR